MQSNLQVETVVLYHFAPSLCSQKVRLALDEKGVAYRSKPVDIGPRMQNYEPWYARINPRMVVPTLVVNGEVITDSAHIIGQIDARFCGPDLRSGDVRVRTQIQVVDALEIRELAYGRTTGLLGFLVRGVFQKRIRVLTEMRDEHPELASLYEARLADVRAWKAVSTSPEQLEVRRDAVQRALDGLHEALHDGAFVVGDGYTLADVIWTVMLARLYFMGWSDRMSPEIHAYYGRMKARPSFRTADVWEHPRPGFMIPLMLKVLAHRVGLS